MSPYRAAFPDSIADRARYFQAMVELMVEARDSALSVRATGLAYALHDLLGLLRHLRNKAVLFPNLQYAATRQGAIARAWTKAAAERDSLNDLSFILKAGRRPPSDKAAPITADIAP